MIKLKNYQNGFGLVEALLIFIAITLAVGVGFYIKNSTTGKKAPVASKTVSSSSPKSSTASKSVSDSDLIIAAVKSYTGASTTGQAQQDAVVDPSTITIVGNNAKGHVAFPPDGGGAAFIAHKDNGVWKVIFEGQQAPDPSLGAQYNLPQDWYAPSN